MRIRTILAAAAAPATLAAVLLGTAGQASAATNNPNANPGNGAAVITSQAQLDTLAHQGQGTIAKNVVINAGTADQPIWLQWTHITGNLSIEGDVMMTGDTIDGNVSVSGPGSFLGLTNYASHFARDLSVTGSSGAYTGGPGTTSFANWTQYNGPSQVDGNFTFASNTGGLRSQLATYGVHVSGSFTAYGNGPYARPDAPQFNWDTSGLQVDGSQSVVLPTFSS